jgi:hypothetical protein
VRKPADYPIARPGDLVEIDTLDVRPSRGISAEFLASVTEVLDEEEYKVWTGPDRRE